MTRRRKYLLISLLILLLLLALAVWLFLRSEKGQLLRAAGTGYTALWSQPAEDYGMTLHVLRRRDGTLLACATRPPGGSGQTALDTPGQPADTVLLTRAFAENGDPETELLYLFAVEAEAGAAYASMAWTYRALTEFAVEPVGDVVVVLCRTRTTQYSRDWLRDYALEQARGAAEAAG